MGGTRIGPLVRYFFSADKLSTDKYAVTILDIVFGCYTADSHHWTLGQLSIDIGHRKKNNNKTCKVEFNLAGIQPVHQEYQRQGKCNG